MAHESAPTRGRRGDGPAAPPAEGRKVLSVGDATRLVRAVLEGSLPPMWVAGEVSNLRRPTSGHVYLTLKDSQSQLKAVIWRGTAAQIPFRLEDGLEVLCFGRLTVYEPRGEYQIAVDAIEPKGIGAAQLALEQLKRRLAAEGLFEPGRKRPLPRFPGCIALVTSATGAAVRDILEVIERRCPKLRVILCPVRVQGDGAAAEVAAAIDAVSRHGAADVLIVGRGGGSQEDLWAFNDEGVARAIARCRMPVISSVGHAIDTTIADLVADRRALTPTEAAELATPLVAALVEGLEAARERLRKALLVSVRGRRERLDMIAQRYAFREPIERVRRHYQRLDDLSGKLPREVRRRLEALRERLGFEVGRLEGLSPLGVLARGYSVTTRAGESAPLRDAGELRPGDRLRTRLARGEVHSEVIERSSCPTNE
jgi:exodeoxyribonuclease VII large subunit